MNFVASKTLRVNLIRSIQKSHLSTEPYPYTTELYKKNYIKYPVQSKQAILHDYVFHGDERLKSLDERLNEFKEKFERKQIGHLWQLPKIKELKKSFDTKIEENKKSKQMELDSKELKINVSVEEFDKINKVLTALKGAHVSAEHYGVFNDLFGNEYFRPVVDLKVDYSNKRVFYGNKLEAKDTVNAPSVNFEDILKIYEHKKEKVYHSLIFVNLDGNFSNSQNEVLLWFKSNVKNGDFKTGKDLIDYLQPFPMRGSGWHRCVFILFEHKTEINFKLQNSTRKFSERNFKFSDFYKNYSKDLVPVGLSFYQTEWDLSVKKVFYNHFELKEPVYEFNFESKFVPRFEKYPKDSQPFNWYFHEYVDKKELNEHVMKEYIKELSPFEATPEPAKYPLIDLKRQGPRWHKFEMENMRKRRQQFSIIPFKYFSPTIKIQQQIENLPFQQNKE